MFTQSLPMNILSALAEKIADSLTSEDVIEREFYNGNMVDSYNIGNSHIIQELVANRTATTKEFLMSDETIMVQQFVEPVHYSVGIVTALCPHLGYKKSAKLAKESLNKNIPIKELLLSYWLIDKERLDEILDPYKMTGSKIRNSETKGK